MGGFESQLRCFRNKKGTGIQVTLVRGVEPLVLVEGKWEAS